MGQTLTTLANALEYKVLPIAQEQINVAADAFAASVLQTTVGVSGDTISVRLPYGLNGGVGAGTETGALPTAAGKKYAKFLGNTKNFYSTIELSDKAIRATRGAPDQLIDALKTEIESIIMSSKHIWTRQFWGDGTGSLAVLTANGTASNIIACDTVNRLVDGMVVDVCNAGAAVSGKTGRTITKVTRGASPTVTLSGATMTISTDDYLTIQGSAGLEMTGIESLFGSASTYYGLTKSAYTFLNPTNTNINGAFDYLQFETALDEVGILSECVTDHIVTSMGVYKKVMDNLKANKLLQEDPMLLTGGYKAMSYKGIPITKNKYIASGVAYLLSSNDWKVHQLCDWSWLKGANDSILNQVAGTPKLGATLVKYADLLCYAPAGQAKLYGITE